MKESGLYVVLNWGLGHATRSVPLIEQALARDPNLTIGSDGEALAYLKKRFPASTFLNLPQLRMHYQFSRVWMDLVFRLPLLLVWIVRDMRWCARHGKAFGYVISDGRLGFPWARKGCTFVNHQLAGSFGGWYESSLFLLTRTLQWRKTILWFPGKKQWWPIRKFPEGVRELGALSAIPESTDVLDQPLDVLVVLSGSASLQDRLLKFILPELTQKSFAVVGYKGLTYDFEKPIEGEAFHALWHRAQTIYALAGYSTLMDIMVHEKKGVLFPTPGQWEQQMLSQLNQNTGEIVFRQW